jgi:hypothetical protein
MEVDTAYDGIRMKQMWRERRIWDERDDCENDGRHKIRYPARSEQSSFHSFFYFIAEALMY